MESKQKQSKSKEPNQVDEIVNVGLIGHIDHGKTTLLYALTGQWADKHSEELKRGITIKLGYANLTIRKCKVCKRLVLEKIHCNKETEVVKRLTFIDVPGHEMLMATMLSGAALMDAALLVIAANEPCPQPQTKEHLIALQVKGVKNIIIVQNKIDLVSKEEAIKNYYEIKEFVKGTVAENATIIPVSAQQGIGIDILLEELTKLKAPKRDINSNPIFLIARSFDVNKPGTPATQLTGTVLGGVLLRGKLRVGDEIEIKPGIKVEKKQTKWIPLKTKIAKLVVLDQAKQEVTPCGSMAIATSLDPSIGQADKLAGNVAGLINKLPEPSYELKIKFNLFKEVFGTKKAKQIEPLKVNEALLLSINTSTTLGIVKQLIKDEAIINLKIPVIAFKGSRVGIARNLEGHWRLIGWGEII